MTGNDRFCLIANRPARDQAKEDTMTNLSRLVRWSGLASMVGGPLFAVGVAIHPLRHGQAVNASPYSAIHVLIAVALMLVLFGLVGLYTRQSEPLGKLGLYGFTLAFIGNVWTYGLLITEGFLWPAVGQHDPAAVHNLDPNADGVPGGSLLFIFFVGLALFAMGWAWRSCERVCCRVGVACSSRWAPCSTSPAVSHSRRSVQSH
jgi:hypothetical protein